MSRAGASRAVVIPTGMSRAIVSRTGTSRPGVRRTGRFARALLLAVVVAPALALAPAGSAAAHDALVSTSPADGSTVDVAPDTVVLTFDQPAIALGTKILVRGPDGATLSTGDPVLLNSTVNQALLPDRPAGAYTVEWRVTSADGHTVSGTFTFTASAATTGPTQTASPGTGSTPSSTPTDVAPEPTASVAPGGTSSGNRSAGIPVWLVGGGVGLLAVVAVVVVLLMTRGAAGGPTDGPADGSGRTPSDPTGTD